MSTVIVRGHFRVLFAPFTHASYFSSVTNKLPLNILSGKPYWQSTKSSSFQYARQLPHPSMK